MRLLDEQYTRTPFYGVRRMHTMGLETLYAKPRTSHPQPGHRVYLYVDDVPAIE